MRLSPRLINLLPGFLRERILRAAIGGIMRPTLGKRNTEAFMKGWKTLAGGIGLIASGIGLIAKEIVEGTFNYEAIMNGVSLIGAGFAAIGLGHKIQKNTEAVK